MESDDYLLQLLNEDPFSVDLQWSLFVSAVQSYRYDTVLRPFPPMFLKTNGEKDMKSLEQTVNSIPNVTYLKRGMKSLSFQQLELLKWVLDSKEFSIKSLDKNQITSIREKTGHIVNAPEPNFIFEVVPSDVSDAKFESVRNNRNVHFAYHGSRIENFFSILHNGLASNMNKRSFFGEGTYLSSEMCVCMNYCPTGLAWDHSELGNRLGCMAVCEIIDDPGVKCQVKKDDKIDRRKARAGNSEGGDVPEKFYVVQNNEVIRVRYLLIWSERTGKIRNRSTGIQSWIRENKFVVLLSMYILILTLVGLFNSKAFQYHMRKYFKYR